MEKCQTKTLIIPGYHLHSKVLGEGGFGKVKLGRHLLTNKEVAVKILNKERMKNELDKIDNEIRALKVLCHKNIAKLYQIYENDNHICLIMEYCSGGELFDMLTIKKRLSEPEARQFLRTLISTLAFIHVNGIAHRDLKPENILFGENGEIKLIDFGLCAFPDSKTNIGKSLDCLTTCCGTPTYVAPEVLIGSEYNGPAADIWSTGVLLYTLLCGFTPFHHSNIATLYKMIQSGQYEIPKFLSLGAQDLIKRMLCVDPKTRIKLQEIWTHRWLNIDQICPKYKNLEAEILCENENILDVKILLKCSAMFPSVKLSKLQNILNSFDYYSATYWLISKHPELYPDFNQNYIQNKVGRRSRSFHDDDLPKVFQSEHETANQDKNTLGTPINNIEHKIKRILPQTDAKDVLKRSKEDDKKTIRKNLFNNNNDKENIPLKNQINQNVKSSKKLKSGQQVNKSDTDEYHWQTNQINDPTKETPKKSLIKWFMENVTPRKTPRPFIMKDKYKTTNIMKTNYTDCHECLRAISEILRLLQVNYHVKDYIIRGVISSGKELILVFELETMICSKSKNVVLKHKRIRGAAMDYVGICDKIKTKLDKSLT